MCSFMYITECLKNLEKYVIRFEQSFKRVLTLQTSILVEIIFHGRVCFRRELEKRDQFLQGKGMMEELQSQATKAKSLKTSIEEK